METQKRYFLVRSVNAFASGANPIWGITDNEEYAKSVQDVFTDYEEVKMIDLADWRKQKVKEIAPLYHDRICMSILSGFGQKCKCCGKIVSQTMSIEHETQDYSKDLSICIECYTEIVKFWKGDIIKKTL